MYSYLELLDKITKAISDTLGIQKDEAERLLSEPPTHIPYDLSFPLLRFRPTEEITEELAKKLAVQDLVDKVVSERGYLNIGLDRTGLSEKILKEVLSLDAGYGSWPRRGETIVIEHTSANPVHPLHIGHGRNMMIGDTLARILYNYGYDVQTRFYVNDLGRQTALLALGIKCLGGVELYPADLKQDHWYGYVYALTNHLIELNKLKREREASRENAEKYIEITSKIDETVANISRLSEKIPEAFERLSDCIMSMDDPETEIQLIMNKYEKGDEAHSRLIRKIVNDIIEGFKETMLYVNVVVDKWDYESDLVWSKEVDFIIERLRRTPYYTYHKGTEALAVDAISKDEKIRRNLRIPEGMEIPPLILRRSDGTTLYVTRDIAYTIRKFNETNPIKVINVVAKEQMLPQAQLRLSLYALGYPHYAENLVHYMYEMVLLPGKKMSGRAGVYVTLDEIVSELERMAKSELRRRYPDMSSQDIEESSRRISVASLRYALISVEPDKQLVFKEEDVLNFEKNTAPYLLYSYARAKSVLRKTDSDVEGVPLYVEKLVESEQRYNIIKQIGKYPMIARKSAEELKIELISNYLWRLSQAFNQWYDTDPILREPDEKLRAGKIMLVKAFQIVLRNGLRVLGIEPLERL